MTRRIGFIAALAGELKPFTRGWTQHSDGSLRQQRSGVELVAVARGMGAVRAAQAVALAEAGGPLTALVSVGWAGATTCGVQPGTAYEVGQVLDPLTSEQYATMAVTNPVLLVTADHVAGRKEKRHMAETYGASLVDMEAAAVARLARERQIPFYCWKAITDMANDDLPDFNRFLDQDKQLQTGRMAAYALGHPRFWPVLMHMGRNSKSGAEALAITLNQWIDEGRYADSSD